MGGGVRVEKRRSQLEEEREGRVWAMREVGLGSKERGGKGSRRK